MGTTGTKDAATSTTTPAPRASGLPVGATPGGPVQRALRGLGFEQGQQLLSPTPTEVPQQVALPSGARSLSERVADLIVSGFGTTPAQVAEGLKSTGAARDAAAVRALEARVGAAVVREAMGKPALPGKLAPDATRDAALSAMLVRTGRASDATSTGALGGERTQAMDERAETSAGVVLRGMEAGTRENQRARAAETGEARPLTHAVSGHGKGTDQMGRLVHGRRADELAEDLANGTTPTGSTPLTGNTHGIADTTTPAYTTVGSDPSNVSGAFTTNVGMLQAVGEAFAQADMVGRHSEAERAAGREAGLDQKRFATTVTGSGRELGYNIEAKGQQKQEAGAALQSGEAEARFQSVERTDGLQNATVVLDPAFVNGHRAGWNLQTAFANQDTPSDSYSRPGDVTGGEHDLEARKQAADAQVKAAKGEVAAAEKAVKGAQGKIDGRQKGIDAKQKAAAKLNPVPQKMQDEIARMQAEKATFEAEKTALEQALADARAILVTAQTAQTAAADAIRRHAVSKTAT